MTGDSEERGSGETSVEPQLAWSDATWFDEPPQDVATIPSDAEAAEHAGDGIAPSPEQQAVRDRAGQPTVLVAAAGSGKTRVLTWLYCDAVLGEHLQLEELLAITFTNRAAGELRHRIAEGLRGTGVDRDPDLSAAWIGTFHGICRRLLAEFAGRRRLDPGFGVIDEVEAAELQETAWQDAVGSVLVERGAQAAALLAQVGEAPLRDAVVDWWTARRSAGELHPTMPQPRTGAAEVAAAARELARAAGVVVDLVEELRAGGSKAKSLGEAERRMAAAKQEAARTIAAVERGIPSGPEASRMIADVEACALGRLKPVGPTPEAEAFRAAHAALAVRIAEHAAGPTVELLGELAARFSRAYERAKRDRQQLDHDDLELETLALLREHEDVRSMLARRFTRIYVDEYQDTNARQAELIELLSGDAPWLVAGGPSSVTVVGDPRQAIYGFRHASVELIERARAEAPPGAALALTTNYRSDGAVLAAIDAAWTRLRPEHEAVAAGRGAAPLTGGGSRLELLVTKESPDASWKDVELGAAPGETDGAALAEARLVAARVLALREEEPGGEVAILARTRATLALAGEALAAVGVKAVLDGGDGFWARPEVADLVAWLRLVRSPLDDAALVAVLASPLGSLSTDGLAAVGAAAAPSDAGSRLDELRAALAAGRLPVEDAARLRPLLALLAEQQRPGRAQDPVGLLDEIVEATRYDEHVARLELPRRRLANIARLRRLAAGIAADGGDLTTLVDRAAAEQASGVRVPEAASGAEAAVRLMTVHQSKGLEFDTVIVMGLGSTGRSTVAAVLGDDRRLGVRLRLAPGEASRRLFDHEQLAADVAARESDELQRVLYVALTRARERLIVSGAGTWTRSSGSPFDREHVGAPPIRWLAPALVPEITALAEAAPGIAAGTLSAGGVAVTVSEPGGDALPAALRAPAPRALPVALPPAPEPPGARFAVRGGGPPAPAVLSYSALARHRACGLRFHAETVLGLGALAGPQGPSTAAPAGQARAAGERGAGQASAARAASRRDARTGQLELFGPTGAEPEREAAPAPPRSQPAAPGASGAVRDPSPDAARGPTAAEVGTVVHGALERLGASPTAQEIDDAIAAAARQAGVSGGDGASRSADLRSMVTAAARSSAWRELWQGGAPRRELRFTIAVGGTAAARGDRHLLGGVVDAQRADDRGVVVVDWKTDRVAPGQDLTRRVDDRYGIQRAAYALAALRAGAATARVRHVFLAAAPAIIVEAAYGPDDIDELDGVLAAAAGAVAAGEAGATAAPDRLVCRECPAGDTLCGWSAAARSRAPGAGPADRSAWAGTVLPRAAG